MSGPPAKRQKTSLRFDVEDASLNDACVVVQDVKFYVSKQHLSMHCEYFRSMFSGRFAERNQREIVLHDVEDPVDFQKFLELINGVSCLTDDNIDRVSRLADMVCAEIAQDRCLDFLNEKSLMSARKKFEIAVKYNFMRELKADIISAIRTHKELKDIVPGEIFQLDDETTKMFFKKSMELLDALSPPPPPPPAFINPPPGFIYPPVVMIEPVPFVPAPQPQFRNDLLVDFNPPADNNLAPTPQPQIQAQDPVIHGMFGERLRPLDEIRVIHF